MTSELDRGISRRLGQFVSGCSVLAIAFGLWVLTGWTLHIEIVKRLLPGQVAVKANTAICFILIGVALWILRKEQPPSVASWRLAAKIAAILVSVVGLLSLSEFLWGWDLGIDQLVFFAGPSDIAGSVRPGLMSPITALQLFCAWACPAAAGRQDEIWPLVGTVVVRWRGRGFPVWHPGFCSGSDFYTYSHLSHYRLRLVSALVRVDVLHYSVRLGGISHQRNLGWHVDAAVVAGRDPGSPGGRLAALEGTGAAAFIRIGPAWP